MTAVLIDCTLQGCMFGSGEQPGRVLRGIEAVVHSKAQHLFWIGDPSLVERVYREALSTQLKVIGKFVKRDSRAMGQYIQNISRREIKVRDEAIHYCAQKQIKQLIVIED